MDIIKLWIGKSSGAPVLDIKSTRIKWNFQIPEVVVTFIAMVFADFLNLKTAHQLIVPFPTGYKDGSSHSHMKDIQNDASCNFLASI